MSREDSPTTHLPVRSAGSVHVVRLDFEAVKHDSHLFVGRRQEGVRAIDARRIVRGIAWAIELALLARRALVRETAGAVWGCGARHLVFRLERILGLKSTSLQLPRTEHHHQPRSVAHHAHRQLGAAQLVIELVIGVRRLLTLQIDLQVAICAVRVAALLAPRNLKDLKVQLDTLQVLCVQHAIDKVATHDLGNKRKRIVGRVHESCRLFARQNFLIAL